MVTIKLEVDPVSAQLRQVLTDYAASGGDFRWIHDGWREESILYPQYASPTEQLVCVGQFYAWWLRIISFGQNGGRIVFDAHGGSLILDYPDDPKDWEKLGVGVLSIAQWDEIPGDALNYMLERQPFYTLFNRLDAGMDGQLYEALDNQLSNATYEQMWDELDRARPEATGEELDAAMADQPVNRYVDGLKALFSDPVGTDLDAVQAQHPENFPLSPTTVFFMMDNRYRRASP